MEKSFDKIIQDWHAKVEADEAKREADLEAEFDASAAYHERTGKDFHLLGSVEQRKEIEYYKETNDLHS